MRPLGVDPDAVDGPVDTDAAGEALDRLDRVLLVEVDRLGALPRSPVEAVAVVVDDEDAAGALLDGAGRCQLADDARPEHRHRVTGADLGQAGTEPRGRQDVGEQDGVVVAHVVRQPHRPGVGEGDPSQLGLEPVDGTGRLRASEEAGAGVRAVGVGPVGLGAVPGVGSRSRTHSPPSTG